MGTVVVSREPALVRYVTTQSVTITVSVYNDAGTLTDPSGGAVLTVTHPVGVDTTPTLAHPSTGVYTATVELDDDGRWIFHGQSDGSIVAAGKLSIAVEGSGSSGSLADEEVLLAPLDAEVGSIPSKGPTVWHQRRFWVIPDIDPLGISDASTAINAALNARQGACVYLPEGFPRITSPLIWPAANGVTLLGRGGSDRTQLQLDVATQPAINISNVQHPSIRNLMLNNRRAQESGATVLLSGCFQPTIENVRFDKCADPIWAVSCTETWLWDIMSSASFGSHGILYYGAAGATANAMKIRGGSHAINYHYAVTSVGDWATSTAYVQGDVRWAGGRLWQCSTAGTSAGSGSGPAALPSTDSTLARSTEVTDNTAKWRFLCQGTYTHLAQGPYSAALNVMQCSFIYGMFGFRMYDDVVAGGSAPIINYFSEVEFDHQYETGIRLERGSGSSINHCWISSVLKGGGGEVQSTFGSNWKFHNTEIFGCATDGLLISKGLGRVTDCNIGNNSQSGTGNYDGIRTAAGITKFVFNNNTSGTLDGGSATQRYGINVVTGASDHYSIQGNLVTDNVTGGVNDGGSGSDKEVGGNVE